MSNESCVPAFRRAQASVEMFVLVGLLLLVLVMFSIVSHGRYAQFVSDRQLIEAKAIARTAALELNAAVVAGDGYAREFELPGALFGGESFALKTVPVEQLVEITWGAGHRFVVPVLSSNVSERVFAGGKNVVRNEGGAITLA